MVGFHVLGPNAGEITQGYALGVRLGAKKSDFANLIGIHPTTAEVGLHKDSVSQLVRKIFGLACNTTEEYTVKPS